MMGEDGVMSEHGGAASIVTQTRVRPGQEGSYAAWQERMSERVAEADGFLGQQLVPANPPSQPDWVIIQRFSSRDEARAWLDSSERADMLAEASDIFTGDDSIAVLDQASGSPQAATAVIRTTVAPDDVARFRDWHQRIDAAQSRRPGYVGCALQEPVPGVQDDWVTILAFDSRADLDVWLASEERAGLVAEAQGFAHDTDLRTVESGFEEWFRFSSGSGAEDGPAPWKLNYLILIGLYPIVMAEIIFLNPLLEWLPLALSNLIGNVLSVALLGWPVLALLSKGAARWTRPGGTPRSDLVGALVALAVLAVLIATFWVVDLNVSVDPITDP
jgi:hypothetical protein